MNAYFRPYVFGCLGAVFLSAAASSEALADSPKAAAKSAADEKKGEPLPELPPSNAIGDPEVPPALEAPPPPPPPEAEAPPPPEVPTTYEVEEDDSIPEDQVHTKMASPTTFGFGLLIGGAGFVGLVTGTGLRYGGGDATCPDCPLTDTQAQGLGLMVVGGLSLVIGGVMVWYGARPVPDRPTWAKAIPAVGVGPGSVRMRWTF